MERKSNNRKTNYRAGSPSHAEKLARFKQQMADVARGELLLKLREDRHWSQSTAAHKIGVTDKTIRSWESGGAIKWKNARSAGRVYGVDPESLVSRPEEETSDEESDEPQELDDPSMVQMQLRELVAGQATLLAEIEKANKSLRALQATRRRDDRPDQTAGND